MEAKMQQEEDLRKFCNRDVHGISLRRERNLSMKRCRTGPSVRTPKAKIGARLVRDRDSGQRKTG